MKLERKKIFRECLMPHKIFIRESLHTVSDFVFRNIMFSAVVYRKNNETTRTEGNAKMLAHKQTEHFIDIESNTTLA